MEYRIILTLSAFDMLDEIKDNRTKKQIKQKILQLKEEPLQLGKALIGELEGYYSIRAAQGRYRIIYGVSENTIAIVGIGLRHEGEKKDIYQIAKRLIQEGLI